MFAYKTNLSPPRSIEVSVSRRVSDSFVCNILLGFVLFCFVLFCFVLFFFSFYFFKSIMLSTK